MIAAIFLMAIVSIIIIAIILAGPWLLFNAIKAIIVKDVGNNQNDIKYNSGAVTVNRLMPLSQQI